MEKVINCEKVSSWETDQKRWAGEKREKEAHVSE